MGLTRRQRRLLDDIDAEFCRSDPRLAGILGAFDRLAAAEEMPGHEHVDARPLGVRSVLPAVARAITWLTPAALPLRSGPAGEAAWRGAMVPAAGLGPAKTTTPSARWRIRRRNRQSGHREDAS
jgi:hypothetical protein